MLRASGSRQALGRRVILVGALRGALKDDRIGGQVFACTSLMTSRLSTAIRFVPIDSSIRSIKASSKIMRIPSALWRLSRRAWLLVFRARRPSCLMFSSHGSSFVEKGAMTLMAWTTGARSFLFPRSGLLEAQVDRSALFRAYVRFVLARATLVLCQSESWRRYFQRLAPRGRYLVVENWLPDEAFIDKDAPVSGSGGRDFVVGYFNRIEVKKGIFDFLDAVQIAAANIPRLRAVIYGDGTSVRTMRQYIAERGLEGMIEYRGWLRPEDKAEKLRALDVYVFASHAEGFPNSLLEVLALKVPVVSVRVGAVPDILENGKSALLTGIGDVRGISGGLVRLAEDRAMASSLASAAYDRVLSCNTLESAVAKLERVLT